MTSVDVREVMTTPVMTVEPGEALSDVGWAMNEKNIKSLAVVDADCDPVGIITSTDFVRMAADEEDPTAVTVGEYMTEDVVTVAPETSVEAAAKRLLSGEFNHAPVFDGSVVGMVSTTDLLELLAGEDDSPTTESD